MLDIILKIVNQETRSRSQLSTRKFKLMMVLENQVEANWTELIFSCMLENVKRARGTTKMQLANKVQYGLIISYILEHKLLGLHIHIDT